MAKDRVLRHEPHESMARVLGGQPSEREVKVARVIDGDDRTTDRRNAIKADDVESDTQPGEQRLRSEDHGSVDEFGHARKGIGRPHRPTRL